MSSIAAGLMASLVDSSQGLAEFIRIGLGPEHFKGPEESSQWELLSTFVVKYGQIPSRDQFLAHGWALPAHHPEPIAWYADQLKSRFTHGVIKQAVLDVQALLNQDHPAQAQETLIATVLRLTRSQFRRQLVDFATEGKVIIATEMLAKKLQGEDYGIKFGWPTLDAMADGLFGGDVVTIVGRPASGKSFAMLYTASHAWRMQNKRPMFVTMEMKPLSIVQRLAAMNAVKPITQLKKAELSTASEKDLMQKLGSYQDKNQFWVVDGALTATINDIILLARQLKPDVVWIDGAYLVRGESVRQQRWDRVTEVLERVKSELAEALDMPVVISFQFNRDSLKKGGGLEHIAYADAVGQLSSVVLALGLSEAPESVEHLAKRRVEILKGRNGESGGFDINWLFDSPGPNFMDFTEISGPDKADLQWGVE